MIACNNRYDSFFIPKDSTIGKITVETTSTEGATIAYSVGISDNFDFKPVKIVKEPKHDWKMIARGGCVCGENIHRHR